MKARTDTAAVGDADRSFVGRDQEMSRFRDAFAAMLHGRRTVFLLAGEPGIGKTRCAEAIAAEAEDRGALTLWGRCYEEPGAPPFWPWIQILRGLIDANSKDETQLLLGSVGTELASLLPELPDDGRRNEPAIDAGSAQARFRFFDAVGQFLASAARQVPLVVVLDNLHWADAPSLSLLEFLNEELASQRVLIVATYRDTEVSRTHPLVKTLGELSRDARVQRVRLGGLDETAVGMLASSMLDESLTSTACRTIYEQTDGNPLFAIELIKVLEAEGRDSGGVVSSRIPDGVRETIGRRLAHLSGSCNDLLSVASVLGRRFTIREVALTGGFCVEHVLENIESAVRAGIVHEQPDRNGEYLFSHALVRETLYEEIPTLVRLQRHAAAADALAKIHGAIADTSLARIAHHYHEALALGHADDTIRFGLLAAQHAVRIYAYEAAVTHYDQALAAMQHADARNVSAIAATILLKTAALKELGAIKDALETLFGAIDLVRYIEDLDLLTDVLMVLAIVTSNAPQQHLVPLLTEVINTFPDEDSPGHAKALATMAFASRNSAAKADTLARVDAAVSMARRLADPDLLCVCHQLAAMALRGLPDLLERRIELGFAHIEEARRAANASSLAEAIHWQILNLFESGDIGTLEELLQEIDNLGLGRVGMAAYHKTCHRVTLALLRGEWAGLEERIESLRELGLQSRREDAEGVYGAQMFTLNRLLGRLQHYEPIARQFLEGDSARQWKPGLMLLCDEIGLKPEARKLLDDLMADDGSGLCRDELLVACLVYATEVTCSLQCHQHAQGLYDRLAPYAGQVANHPTAVCFGATDLFLGMLATLTADGDAAERHFQAALTTNRRIRAWPMLAKTQYEYARWLSAQNDPETGKRARDLLQDAEQLASRLKMTTLLDAVEIDLGGRSASPVPDGLTAREIEVLELLAIGRSNKDVAKVLDISLATVATHVRSILNKTGCANRTEAAAYALRSGLVESG